MNLKHDNAPTAMRTRKLMPKPVQQGDQDFGANVLPIGTHLREFEILDLVGEGGFGIVYLAYDHSLERYVALKEYMPSGLATRTTKMAVSVRSQKKLDTFTAGLKSFINEARMLAQFDSPALVKVHTFWEGNGTAYMVMPYYEGMTLKQALHTRKIVPTEAWIRMLLADLCDAIEILHRAHCLHRDIAPDNILLLKDGRPLLLDFGAARRVIGDLTQCFTAILKPGFAPIEQYADIAGLRQGAWTDIYALAAVVYYLVTGKAPPPSVARMVHDELLPAREAGKGRYSEAFLAAVDKSLSVRPEQRFHSIDELRRALGLGEPEPRTVPRAGSEWSTTVARTIPVANFSPQVPPSADAAANVPAPAATAAPDSHAFDGTRYTNPAQRPDTKASEKLHDKAVSSKVPYARTSPEPEMAAAPEDFLATQIAGDHYSAPSPSHRFENDAAVPPRRERQGWLVLAILFAVGIGSGIYVGANRSWDGLSEQAILAGSGKENVTGMPPAPAPAGESSSGASSPSEAVGPAPPETAERAQTGHLVSEIDQWKIASKSNDASAYENYLREYPQGRYAAIAQLRLQRLQAAASPSSQPEVAAAAAPAPLPVSPPAATPPRAALPTAVIPPVPATASKEAKVITGRPEEAAWTTASAIHSAASYREYLRKYPKGGYAALARDRLATMQAGAAASAIPSAQNASPQQPLAPESAPVAGKSPEASLPLPGAVASASSTASPSAATPPAAAPPQRAGAAEVSPPASGNAAASPPAQEAPAPQAALKPQETVPAEPIASSSGKSALRFDDQTITGDFSVDRRSGLVSGKVKISWSNGNQFEGTLVQGSKEGKGKFTWSSGQRYSGEWIRDMPNGKGVFIFPDGSRYEGDVKDGLPHGQGSTRFKNGIVYTGDWVRGKSHGHGRYIWTDGSYWEGEFRDDKKTDNGKMHFPNKNTRELSGAAPATNVGQEVETMAASTSTDEK